MTTPTAPDTRTDAEKLTAAILTRRAIMCKRVDKRHIEGGCPNCGT